MMFAGGVTDMKSFHGIQALGIMQALKTGDPTIDTLIAMLLPFVFTKVIHILTNGKYFTYRYWFPPKKSKTKEYTRTISHRTTQNSTNGTIMNYDEDTYNSFLIRAIKLYMHHKCQRELQDADLELTDVKSMIVCDDDDAIFGVGGSCQSPSAALAAKRRMLAMQRAGIAGGGGTSTTSTASMLRDCTIIASQIKDQWQEVAGTYDESKVFIKFSDSTSGSGSSDIGNDDSDSGGNSNGSSSSSKNSKSNDNSGGSNRSIQICLKSHGSKAIDMFVQTAYQWYMDELKKVEKNDRYLFDFRSIDVNRNRMPTFAKFKLSDNKTFESLFSQQCHAFRKTLDQFLTKTGKYAVPGYPYKLGLSLHGPPGTGKTSFIKAIAHYTNRHIVTIPLSRIATNQDLIALFFNGTYNVAGSQKVAKLGFENVIFVLEDVDAGSKVVMSRELRLQEEKRREAERRLAFAVLSGQTAGEEGGDLPQGSSQGPSPLSTLMPSGPPSLASKSISPVRLGGLSSTVRMEGDDELDLTGLLNVLDGVVDTPGRIVIMTTNHPEMLDPALIRPGRIDKVMEMGYMLDVDVIAMLEHYYQTKLSKAERKRVKLAVNYQREGEEESLQLVPARVEQLTMEKDSVGEMIEWLENEAGVSNADCSATDSDTLSSSEHPTEADEATSSALNEKEDPLEQSSLPQTRSVPSYIEETDDEGDY